MARRIEMVSANRTRAPALKLATEGDRATQRLYKIFNSRLKSKKLNFDPFRLFDGENSSAS